MKKENKTEKTKSLDSSMPEDALLHDNGVWYREIKIDGLEDTVKLFNSLRPNRLEGETSSDYKIRRKLLKLKEKEKPVLIYNSKELGQYVNENKKDKFKKK
jgi:hypothetical protein